MIKVYCEKCGKEISSLQLAFQVIIEAPEIRTYADNAICNVNGYQICRDCIGEVAKFIGATEQTEREGE